MLGTLAAQVLDYLEPDKTKQTQWITPVDQAPLSRKIMPAAMRLRQAIEQKEKVIVCGDYDCDGIMATAILTDGLRKAGASVGFYVPDRIKEGYGLHEETVRMANEKGYSLLVTVDNGVRADAALALAASLGMSVIVTDHHVMDEPVQADYVVHPTLMEEEYSTLCGAGVAYELLRSAGLADDYHRLLAGIASVGDQMSVTGETRYLIQAAIRDLNHNRDMHFTPFLKPGVVDETVIAFQIVPRLNAPGRLSNLANVNNVVRYFLDQDIGRIRAMALQINEINERRKQMSEIMLRQARQKADLDQPVVYVEDESFHEGIIGLVAGSLCAASGKPVIVAARNAGGCKASMRGPKGFDCMKFLAGFDQFSTLGGHAQAAGFSYDLDAAAAFADYIKQAGPQITIAPVQQKSIILDPSLATVEQIRGLDALRPFGPGFALPPFEIREPVVAKITDMSQGRHRRYTLKNGLSCVHFNQTETDRARSICSVEAFVGTPSINVFKGVRFPQFIIDRIEVRS